MNSRVGYVCLGAASIALPLGFVGPAWSAQVVSIVSVTSASMGKFGEAATGISTVVLTTAGALSVTSGNGKFIGTAPTIPITVTVSCANAGSACSSGANGKILPVTATGRLGSPTTFNVAPGTISPTGGAAATLTFTLPSIPSGSATTFKLGMSIPVNGDNGAGTYGVGTSPFSVAIASGTASTPSGAVTGAISATMYRALSISKVTDLAFGTITRPASGSGSATIDKSTGSLGLTNGFSLASSTRSRAVFSIIGDGAETFTLSLPTSVVMTAGTIANITMALLPTVSSGTVTLGGSIGVATTLSLGVGGSIAMTNSTASGNYTGTFVVSVNYN